MAREDGKSVGELARRLEVSQPRITQLMNLTYLSPAIQAEVAALEAVDGKEPMSERPLREVVREAGWARQWRVWMSLRRLESVELAAELAPGVA